MHKRNLGWERLVLITYKQGQWAKGYDHAGFRPETKVSPPLQLYSTIADRPSITVQEI